MTNRTMSTAALGVTLIVAAAGCSSPTTSGDATPTSSSAATSAAVAAASSVAAPPQSGVASPSGNKPRTFDAMTVFGKCSGALVRFADQSDDDKALLLTNGHCTHEDLSPGTFLTDRDGKAKALVLKGDTPQEAGVVDVDKLVYATMSTTDVAIYRTTTTYKELRDKGGINARIISDTPAAPGMKVAVTSAFWKTSWDCTIDKVVPIVQEAKWRFGNVFTYVRSGCHTKPGSSGAPVVDAASGTVVAINNSGNTEGKKCTEDNPCEIYPDGRIEAVKGAGYATQTAFITQCFTKGALDLTRRECALPGGAAFQPVPATPAA